MSTNAREFEGLYNEGKINILDFVNECRQIDNVLDAEFLEKVEKMRKLIQKLGKYPKENTLKFQEKIIAKM